MKKLIIIAGIAISVLTSGTSQAQVFVKIRPAAPIAVVVRPPCPSPAHIWVDGEWRWNKKRHEYVWVDGFWIKPRPGRAWTTGHWVEGPEGHKWIGGCWVRVGGPHPGPRHGHGHRR